jgi:hypothetical protein
VAGRQSKSKDLNGKDLADDGGEFQLQLPFESFRPPPSNNIDFDYGTGKVKDINNINNFDGNNLDNVGNNFDESYDETEEYYDDDDKDDDGKSVTNPQLFEQSFFDTTDVTTEASDLLTTNSDIVNDEIGPFIEAPDDGNGSIIFEVSEHSNSELTFKVIKYFSIDIAL